jgi:hypothetical protein
MEDTYTNELYLGERRTIKEIANDVLRFEGLDENSIEWSTDRILKPKYIGGSLRPQSEWEDTSYEEYTVNTPMPEVTCKQVIQLLAFTVGATIVIKDNGHIKFANLDISDQSTFTNSYEWNYNDFESIPAAEQLETISDLSQISLPKYYSEFDRSGTESIVANNSAIAAGGNYNNCTVI